MLADIRKHINFYTNGEGEEKFRTWEYGCYAIHYHTQNHGHKYIWDHNLIEEYLLNSGFQNIKETQFFKGMYPNLQIDNPNRQWESLYIKAQKIVKLLKSL